MNSAARFNALFPLWALLAALVAWCFPAVFVPLRPGIVPMLSLVMFCMGLTLSTADFRRIAQAPTPVGLGVLLQFALMPLLAFLLSVLLRLPEQLAAGLILVGCCAGGTASNVICYLAGGNVALSITMTLLSSLIGVFATPLLCWLYIERSIEIDHLAMLGSIVRMVLLPVLAGVAVNHFAHALIRRVEVLLPSLAIMVIAVIIAIIVALNRSRLEQLAGLTLVAVMLHNALGFAGGYGPSRIAGQGQRNSRTIAI